MADKKKPDAMQMKLKSQPQKQNAQEPQAPTSKKGKAPTQGQMMNTGKGFDDLHKKAYGMSGDRLQAYGERMLYTDEDLPLYRHLLLFAIILGFAGLILYAHFAPLDELTRGEGKVIPSSKVQQIQHQEGGIIDAFLVREGQKVKKGDVLIRLRDVGASSDLGSSRARYLGLLAKKIRLTAEAEGLDAPEFPESLIEDVPESVREELNAFRANRSQMQSQISVLEQQSRQRRQEVNEIETRIRDTRRLIRLVNEETDMIKPLVDRGSAPKRDLLQLERTLAEQESELNGLLASLPRAKSAISEAEARIKDVEQTVKTEAQNELSTVLLELKTIEQTLTALQDTKERTAILSPVDGTVKDLRIFTVGGVIRPGDLIMEVVPDDEELLVEARIRPADIAFIHPGQQATVKITAYDFSIYGGLKGEVVDISADTITDDQGESFYEAVIRTEKNHLVRNGEKLNIIPGMVATVDILTGEKTILEFLMKPLNKTLDNALHER